MSDSVPLPENLRQFVASSRWTFAKTYASTWPHEYIVRESVDEELFVKLVEHIRAHGYEGSFYAKRLTYFDQDGLLYWTMGSPIEKTIIVNRCKKEQGFGYRLKHGMLPSTPTDYFKKAPWVVNAGRPSNEGFYYDEFGYKADQLFWADDLDLEPSEIAELQRRIDIKESLDQGLDDRAVESKHGSIPQDLLDHYNTYFRPYFKINLTICGVHEFKEQQGKDWTHIISIWDRCYLDDKNRRAQVEAVAQGAEVLFCFFDDTSNPDDPDAPLIQDIERILYFTSSLTPKSKLLVHCRAGVSRSTATAYAILCQHSPPGTEMDNLLHIESLRDLVIPNRLITQYADEVLKRKGAMLSYLHPGPSF